MLPDVQQMSVVELERLLISNVSRIRAVGKGKITFKAIAMGIGIHFDELQVKSLRDKLKLVKCVERRGSYYVFTTETLVDPDDDAINDDSTLKMMNDLFDSAIIPSPERDVILYFTDDNKKYPCGNCYLFDHECGKCGATSNDVKETDVVEDCDSFRLDISTVGYNERSWYRKSGKKRDRGS